MIVYIMVGPPCTGKTTQAVSMLTGDTRLLRANRDELRIMLKGRYIVGDRVAESVINHLTKCTIEQADYYNCDALIDATHCTVKSIKAIKQMVFGHEVKYIVCEAPYWKQRWRNFWRYLKTGIWIPSHVAKSMNENFQDIKQKIEDRAI